MLSFITRFFLNVPCHNSRHYFNVLRRKESWLKFGNNHQKSVERHLDDCAIVISIYNIESLYVEIIEYACVYIHIRITNAICIETIILFFDQSLYQIYYIETLCIF